MDATPPSTPDDELDLDVTFVESGLEIAGGDTDDCTNQCQTRFIDLPWLAWETNGRSR